MIQMILRVGLSALRSVLIVELTTCLAIVGYHLYFELLSKSLLHYLTEAEVTPEQLTILA